MHGNGDYKNFLRIQQTNLIFPFRFNRFSCLVSISVRNRFSFIPKDPLFFLVSDSPMSSLGQKAFFGYPREYVLMGFYADVERWQFRQKNSEDGFPLIPTAEMHC
jgi:hypothetical protein